MVLDSSNLIFVEWSIVGVVSKEILKKILFDWFLMEKWTWNLVGAHDQPITACGFAKGSNYECLVTGSLDKTVKLWDMRQSNPVMTFNVPEVLFYDLKIFQKLSLIFHPFFYCRKLLKIFSRFFLWILACLLPGHNGTSNGCGHCRSKDFCVSNAARAKRVETVWIPAKTADQVTSQKYRKFSKIFLNFFLDAFACSRIKKALSHLVALMGRLKVARPC